MGAVIDDTTDLAQLAETYTLISRQLQKRGGLLAYLLQMAEMELAMEVAKEAKRRLVSATPMQKDQLSVTAGVTVLSPSSRLRRKTAASAAV